MLWIKGGVLARRASFLTITHAGLFLPRPHQTIWNTFLPCLGIWLILSEACQLLKQAIKQLQLCLRQEQTTAKLLEKLSCFPRVPARQLQQQPVPTPYHATNSATFPVCNDRHTSCLNDYGKTSKENSTVKLCPPPPPKGNQLTENIPPPRVKVCDAPPVKTSEVTHAAAPTTGYKNNNASEAFTKVTSRRTQRARGMESTFASPNLFSALRAQATKPTALCSRTTKKVKERTDNEQTMKLQVQASRRTKHERSLGSKKGAPNCRTSPPQGPEVRQYQTASPPMNVWKVQQPAPSVVLYLHTPRAQDPVPPTKREESPPHDTSSFCSRASLPSLQSSDSDSASYGKHWDAESKPPSPTRHENKLRSCGQTTVCSWCVQDLQMDYEWHKSYVLSTELEAQHLVPPTRRLTEKGSKDYTLCCQ